jgi:hypothetical protein
VDPSAAVPMAVQTAAMRMVPQAAAVRAAAVRVVLQAMDVPMVALWFLPVPLESSKSTSRRRPAFGQAREQASRAKRRD